MQSDDIDTPSDQLYEEWVAPTRRVFVPLEASHNYANSAGWWRLPWQGTLVQVNERGFKPTRVSKPAAGLAEA